MKKIVLVATMMLGALWGKAQNLSSYDYEVPGHTAVAPNGMPSVFYSTTNRDISTTTLDKNGNPVDRLIVSYDDNNVSLILSKVSIDGSTVLVTKNVDLSQDFSGLIVEQVQFLSNPRLDRKATGYFVYGTMNNQSVIFRFNLNLKLIGTHLLQDDKKNPKLMTCSQIIETSDNCALFVLNWNNQGTGEVSLLKLNSFGNVVFFNSVWAGNAGCEVQHTFPAGYQNCKGTSVIEAQGQYIVSASMQRFETGGAPNNVDFSTAHFLIHFNTNGSFVDYTQLKLNQNYVPPLCQNVSGITDYFNIRRIMKNEFNDKLYLIGDIGLNGSTGSNCDNYWSPFVCEYIPQLNSTSDQIRSLSGVANQLTVYNSQFQDGSLPTISHFIKSAQFTDNNRLFLMMGSAKWEYGGATPYGTYGGENDIYTMSVDLSSGNIVYENKTKSDFGRNWSEDERDFSNALFTNNKLYIFYPRVDNPANSFPSNPADDFKYGTFNVLGQNCQFEKSSDFGVFRFPSVQRFYSNELSICQINTIENTNYFETNVANVQPGASCTGCDNGTPSEVIVGSAYLCPNSTFTGFEPQTLTVAPFDPNHTYIWSDGTTTQNGSSYIVNQPGTYTLLISDDCGTIKEEQITIEQRYPASLDLSTENISYCGLTSLGIQIGFSVDPLFLLGSPAVYSYHWEDQNGNILAGQTGFSMYATVNAGATSTFTLVMTTDCGVFEKDYVVTNSTSVISKGLSSSPTPYILFSYGNPQVDVWRFSMVADNSGICPNSTYYWTITNYDANNQVLGTPWTTSTTAPVLNFNRAFSSNSIRRIEVTIDDVICQGSCELFDFAVYSFEPPVQRMKASPNPSTGIFNIELEGASRDAENEVKVYNLRGELVLQTTTFGTKFNIDITREVSGMYTIQVINQEGSFQEKLIKK